MDGLHGTITALITPFRDGAIDFAALEAHIAQQLAAGIDGLLPCGTTGETPTLSPDEQREVMQLTVKLAARRVPVIAGAGANSTAKAIELAQMATACDVDALLVVSPYYNKPSQAGLYQHFSAVAHATDRSIVLYNIPGRCGVEIAIDTICRLYEDHDNIVAVKHATGRVSDAADLLVRSDIIVLSGDDPLTLPLMSLGATGVVSVLANLTPQALKLMTRAARDGDFVTARTAHQELYPLAKALLTLDSNPVPVKTALALRGYCKEEFRLPLCPMSTEARRKLMAVLSEVELT